MKTYKKTNREDTLKGEVYFEEKETLEITRVVTLESKERLVAELQGQIDELNIEIQEIRNLK